VIALNGPEEQSATTIAEFKHLFLAPGFLSFGSVILVVSLIIAVYFGPRYGKKNMMWYIMVCSLIGGLSVSCTQGLGASIVTSIRGENQVCSSSLSVWPVLFRCWSALAVQKLVHLFPACVRCCNTYNGDLLFKRRPCLIQHRNGLVGLVLLLPDGLVIDKHNFPVTPTYYVLFTFSTLVTSVVSANPPYVHSIGCRAWPLFQILYQGLKATVTQILTVVLGFLMICMCSISRF